MAVRIRSDKQEIICAAKSRRRKGDIYIDDTLHYALSVEMEVLHTDKQDKNGADLWYFDTTKEKKYNQ